MKHIDLLIHARWIVPVEPDNTVLKNHTIAIHNGLIVAILPQDKAMQRYTADQTHGLDNHCLIPGLINSHTHLAMSLLRGLADDMPLMTWLNDYIWPVEKQHLSDDFVEVGSALGIAECLRGGVTCVNDMYFYPDATARVVDQSGIRAVLGMVVIDFPTTWASDVTECLHKGQQLHDHYRHHALITTAYAPHAPYTVSDETLATIISNAEELDVPIHMHIHETADEIEQSIATYGMRPLQRLEKLGLLSPRLLAVHMTQLTEQDIAICRRAKIKIIHCPESNLKLASGFCPVSELHRRKINVSIGTDGAASNNDLDMFGEMRMAALLAKATSKDPRALPAHTALRMATLNGAKALGLDDITGSLKKGKAADITAIVLSDLEQQPLYDVISQLVYSTGRDKVTDVWVAGKQLLKNRRLLTLNKPEIIARSQGWADKINQDRI